MDDLGYESKKSRGDGGGGGVGVHAGSPNSHPDIIWPRREAGIGGK